MSRIYVKNNEGKYNIYSTIVDNWLSEKWLTYDQLVDELCKEAVEEINSDLFDSAGEELEGEQHKL